MARPLRVEYEGAVYHVAVRGHARQAIFRDDADREHFVRVLAESVGSFEVRLYLYCLMSNHVHLVLETPRANLGRFMHRGRMASALKIQDSGCGTGVDLVAWAHGQTVAGGV
jgi:putative transposase